VHYKERFAEVERKKIAVNSHPEYADVWQRDVGNDNEDRAPLQILAGTVMMMIRWMCDVKWSVKQMRKCCQLGKDSI